MNLNKWIGIGRLAGVPKYEPATDKSDSKLFFQLAINRVKSDKADFVPVTAWGKVADAGAQYLTKGKEVTVEGRVRFDSVQQEDGSWKNYSGITADLIHFGQDSQKVQKDRAAGVEDPEQLANKLLAQANKPKARTASKPTSAEALAAALLEALQGKQAPKPAVDPVVQALMDKGISQEQAEQALAAHRTATPAPSATTDAVDLPF